MKVKLICVGGKHAGQQVPIPGPKFLIGRAKDCHLRPASELVSLHHAVILVQRGLVVIRDFGSKNGTYVNGERIKSERRLRTGERLTIGPLKFEVHLAAHLVGKKKPNVRSVQEAAAGNVEAGQCPAGDDLDISHWLDEGQGPFVETQAAEPHPPSAVSSAEPGLSQATTRSKEPSEQTAKTAQKKEEKSPRIAGRLPNLKKPAAESSMAAAADMLHDYLRRRR
jgi:pSer/pThr/pTyr-binding forkhead associated (FHA) protein